MYDIVAIIQSLINQNQRIFEIKFNCDTTPVSSPIKTKPSSFYYFGDLCYIFDSENWNRICDIIGSEQNACITDNTEIKLKNGFIPNIIALASTDCGDGCYPVQKNLSKSLNAIQFVCNTPVDSGTIGMVEIGSEEEWELLKQELNSYRRPVGTVFKTNEDSIVLSVIEGGIDVGGDEEVTIASIYNIAVLDGQNNILLEAATDDSYCVLDWE